MRLALFLHIALMVLRAQGGIITISLKPQAVDFYPRGRVLATTRVSYITRCRCCGRTMLQKMGTMRWTWWIANEIIHTHTSWLESEGGRACLFAPPTLEDSPFHRGLIKKLRCLQSVKCLFWVFSAIHTRSIKKTDIFPCRPWRILRNNDNFASSPC